MNLESILQYWATIPTVPELFLKMGIPPPFTRFPINKNRDLSTQAWVLPY